MAYETKFENGTEIDSYLACATVEGFCEGEDASAKDILNAWSYLIGTGECWSLQGWYGRNAEAIISSGYISKDGTILIKE